MPRWKNICRYVHCDSVDAPDSIIPVTWCDGVAAVWYQDEQHRLSHISDSDAGQLMKQDEGETFARPVRDFALLTDEYVFEPGASTPKKVFLRIWRRPEMKEADFKDWWLKAVGPHLKASLESNGQKDGYIQNHARQPGGENSAPLVCDCIDEIGYSDANACDQIISMALNEGPEFSRYVRDIQAIWTEQTVLHGSP